LLRSDYTPTPSHPLALRRAESRLFDRYQRDGDSDARAELVERFLPLAHHLARRYERSTEPFDDLLQVASLALLKAIDRFDPDRGDAFTSFAVPTILGELKRHFRDTGWALHVPRGTQERVLQVNAAIDHMSERRGQSPSPGEVAAAVRLPVEQVLEAIAAGAAYTTASLESPRHSNDGEAQSIGDVMGEEDPRFELIDDRASIGRGLRALPRRERSILYLRFVEGLTQSEIGDRLGISQMHVSRLIVRAIQRVRIVADVAA
jgi:RNA polymerase sigma-B factor